MRNSFTKNVIEEWIIKDEDCPSRRATVFFKNGSFDSCKYTVENRVYSQSDWMFLYSVGDLIRRFAPSSESEIIINGLPTKSAEKRAPNTGKSVPR